MGDHWLPLAIVLLLGMMFFGAKRLPEMGSAVGKTIREFQKSMKDVTEPPAVPVVTPPADHTQITAPSATAMTAPVAPQQTLSSTVEAIHE